MNLVDTVKAGHNGSMPGLIRLLPTFPSLGVMAQNASFPVNRSPPPLQCRHNPAAAGSIAVFAEVNPLPGSQGKVPPGHRQGE